MIIVYLAVCTAGGVLQAVSGFGFVLFVMMFFPYILSSYADSVAVCGILSVLSSGFLTVIYRKYLHWKLISVPVCAYLIINFTVIAFAASQSDIFLKKLLAAVLIILSVYFIFFGDKIKIKPTFFNGIIFGMLSGILGGLFSVSGPPIVLYLLGTSEDNRTYMANIQLYFTITSLYSTLLRLIYGMIDIPILFYSGLGFISVLAGLFIGKKLFVKLSPFLLRKIIYTIMLLSGIIMLL